MIVNFQSDGNALNSSSSNSTQSFLSDIDDIPSLSDSQPNYNTKNINNALSRQFHDLIIGEIASAHLNTLQRAFDGFPQNTAIEEGFNHKSRNEVAINSTKNIMPQLDDFLSKFLNIALEDAVSLSAKNYGEDFVKKDASEEEEAINNEEENENEEEEDKSLIIDQEIIINEKPEEKRPNLLNTIKSLFTKSKENELNNSSSQNSSTINLKRRSTFGPKSAPLLLGSPEDEKGSKTDENITGTEEKSKTNKISKSFPFFKSKNAESNESEHNNEEKYNSSKINKQHSSPKILFQKIFSPKSKGNNENNNQKAQNTVRFANEDENQDEDKKKFEDELNKSNQIHNEIQPNIDSNTKEEFNNLRQESNPVVVENIEDFSSSSYSESAKCHTPNSNPDISNQAFEVLGSDLESEEEIVKNLIRPPTPEKNSSIQLSSDSASTPENKQKHSDNSSNIEKEFLFESNSTTKTEENTVDHSFESASTLKSESKNQKNDNDDSFESNSTSKSELSSPSSPKSHRSNRDQDLLLSASESESESENKIKNRIISAQVNKKVQSSLLAVHLSSSSSEQDLSKHDSTTHKKKEESQTKITYKLNTQQQQQITSSKNIEIQNQKETQNKEKLQKESEGESSKTSMSNVEFIAHELSDFELEHQKYDTDEEQKQLTKSQENTRKVKKSVKTKVKPKVTHRTTSTIETNTNEEDFTETKQFASTYSNKTIQKQKKLRKKSVNNESSQTRTLNEVPLKRRPNIIQENTSFEVFEGKKSSNKKRIKSRTYDISVEIDDDEEEETNTPKRRLSRTKSKGRNSNSSSPHSNSPNYSPVHTHTHTPVPIKPRLILKNNSSSDDEDDEENGTRRRVAQKRVTPTKARRKISPLSGTLSSSPQHQSEAVHSPVIRKKKKKKSRAASVKSNYEGKESSSKGFYNDDDEFNVSIKISGQDQSDSKSRQKSDTQKASTPTNKTRVVKRKKRAASESAPSRIRNRNQPTKSDENEESAQTEGVVRKRSAKTSTGTRRKRQQSVGSEGRSAREAASETIPRPAINDSDDSNRIRTLKTQKRRRLSVDEAVINHKNLAKNGVRSIIVIEFDKKTPIIENFLEQISSNSGAFSQSSPQRRLTSRSRRSSQISEDDGYSSDNNESLSARPKIARHNRSKLGSKTKKKVEVVGGSSDDENNRNLNDNDDNVVINFSERSMKSSSPSVKRRRQESVKPSTLNRSVQPQRKSASLSDTGGKLTKTVNHTELREKNESESIIIHHPIKKTTKRNGRRMASVKNNLGSRKSAKLDEDDDKYFNFNFKKLFDDAEKKIRDNAE